MAGAGAAVMAKIAGRPARRRGHGRHDEAGAGQHAQGGGWRPNAPGAPEAEPEAKPANS